jgi:hypothetical protein
MRATRQFWAVFWMLAVVLAGLIAWFLGNLLYSLFWKQLGDWGFPITEAQMIAYICAHLAPFALALLVTAFLAVLIRNQLAFAGSQAPGFASTAPRSSETAVAALKNPSALDDSIAEYLPDVRVADSLAAQRLFEGRDGDNLIPLLEAEKIFAWARPMGRGEPAPIRVPGNVWRTNQMWVVPKGDNPHMRNQTFIKTKTTNETSYYDLRLNRAQLKRVWPNFEYVTPSPVVPWPDFDKWDKRTNFRLFEIACLWTDREPGLPLTAETVQCFKVLEQAIWDKHLKIRSESVREAIVSAIAISKGRESKANPNWVIDKDALLLYAAGTNEKPRFLFPEERV